MLRGFTALVLANLASAMMAAGGVPAAAVLQAAQAPQKLQASETSQASRAASQSSGQTSGQTFELDAGWPIGDDIAWLALRERDIRLRFRENAGLLGDGEDGVRGRVRRIRHFGGREAPDEALQYSATLETRGLGARNHREKPDET